MRGKAIGFEKLAFQDMHNPRGQILGRLDAMKMIS